MPQDDQLMPPDDEAPPPPQDAPPACRVLDAASLRALAHPLRYQLLELLKEGGPATASELGRRVGESSGSTSYHLRQLAGHDFIEEAPELGSGRERWWRATPGGWTLEGIEGFQDPSAQRDAAIILDEFRRARLEQLERWHREGVRWGPEWIASSIDMTSRMALTHDEARALRDELVAVVDRHRAEVGDRLAGAAPPTGTAVVTINVDVFPTSDPPDTGADGGQAGAAAPAVAAPSADSTP